MPPRSNVPIRIGGSRSRAGCRRCKQRHVKCDERRPMCLRCEKLGSECIYDQPQTWVPRQTSDSAAEIALSQPETLQGHRQLEFPHLQNALTPYASRDVTEVNAARHFALNLGKQFAGHFSSDIWCTIVPRVAQHEPSIWHGLVAVGMLDTSLRLDHDLHSDNSYKCAAINHYGKAIHELGLHMKSTTSARSKDVILLACIVFATFECLQNHPQSTLRHISGGMKLLMQWKNSKQTDDQSDINGYFDRVSLQPIFFSLDSQAVQMGIVEVNDCLSLSITGDQLQSSPSFATVEEAYLMLAYIFNRLSRWAHWIGPSTAGGVRPKDSWLVTERKTLQTLLTEWDLAFNAPPSFSYSRPSVLLLLIHRIVMQIFFDRQVDGPSEMEWDKHFLQFQKAMLYAETFVSLTSDNAQSHTDDDESQQMGSNGSRPVLTFALDIVLPLFLISTRCRYTDIRQRALALLKTCGRREGMWDSPSGAMIAETVINVEERWKLGNGLVPETARVYSVDVGFGEDGVQTITPMRLAQDGGGAYVLQAFSEQ